MRDHVIFKAKTGMCCFYVKPTLLKGVSEEGRVICKIGAIKFHCALLKDKSKRIFVYISKETMKKLGVQEGGEIKPVFKKDKTEIKFDVPKEFAEVLKTDPEAKKLFKMLSPGGKRSLVYLVQRMKTTDKRIEKSLLIADRLKQGVTSARMMNARI